MGWRTLRSSSNVVYYVGLLVTNQISFGGTFEVYYDGIAPSRILSHSTGNY